MAIDYRKTAGELVRELMVMKISSIMSHIVRPDSGSYWRMNLLWIKTECKSPRRHYYCAGWRPVPGSYWNHVKDAYGFVTQLVSRWRRGAEERRAEGWNFTRIVDVISAILSVSVYTGGLQYPAGSWACWLPWISLIRRRNSSNPEFYIPDGIYLPAGHDSGDGGQKFGVNTFYCGRNCMCSGEPGLWPWSMWRAGILLESGFSCCFTSSVILLFWQSGLFMPMERFFEKYLPW